MALVHLKSDLDNPILRGRFEAACVKAALEILYESAQVPLHAERLQWANKISLSRLFTSSSAAKIHQYALCTNATAQQKGIAMTDAEISSFVNSVLSISAGLTELMKP